MQTLEVISVNIWLILISLINLYLLFLILKIFLFKPVKKVLDSRQAELDAQFQTIDYEAYKADPTAYKGDYIKLRVQVYQKVNDRLFNVYTAAAGETDSDSWMGGHYLLNDDRRPQEPALEEGMIVTVYGVCAGKQKMTTANENGDDGLPAVDIVYIDFEGYEPVDDADGAVNAEEASGADGAGTVGQ